MNFDFSEDLNLLRDEARKFLAEQCSTKAVRRILECDPHTLCACCATGAPAPKPAAVGPSAKNQIREDIP